VEKTKRGNLSGAFIIKNNFFFLKKKDNWKETENLFLTYQRPNVIASFGFQEKLGERS
jgi:hypothetical protein